MSVSVSVVIISLSCCRAGLGLVRAGMRLWGGVVSWCTSVARACYLGPECCVCAVISSAHLGSGCCGIPHRSFPPNHTTPPTMSASFRKAFAVREYLGVGDEKRGGGVTFPPISAVHGIICTLRTTPQKKSPSVNEPIWQYTIKSFQSDSIF